MGRLSLGNNRSVLRRLNLSKNIIFLPVVLALVMSCVMFCNNLLVSFGEIGPSKSIFEGPSSSNTSTNVTNFANSSTIRIIPNAISPMAQMAREFFVPQNDLVKVGRNVTWMNNDTVAHTVSSQDKNGNPTDTFDSGNIDPGANWTYTFDQKQIGMNYYYDKLHPYMRGEIEVLPK